MTDEDALNQRIAELETKYHDSLAVVKDLGGSLPRGRRNRPITPPAKRNRAFPTRNALLYISLSYVDFGRVRLSGRTLFLFCL